MKIIVFSDSHGSLSPMEKIMSMHRNADVVVHCGDSRGELDEIKRQFPDKMYYAVRGNCDFASSLEPTVTFTLEGVNFMATHGHLFSVKFGLGELRRAARQDGMDVVFFGHTHIAHNEYDDGIFFINPGACGGYKPSYAVVEVKDGQVLANIAHLDRD